MSVLPSTEEELAWERGVNTSLDRLIRDHREQTQQMSGPPPLKLLSGLLHMTYKALGSEEFLKIEDLIDLFIVALDRLARQEGS
ncbi:Uncharacterised protein [Mycobacteroides abscessus subsp. bolletii]|uniref:hypothetical protein n=1 Tax=Mycobacteroides abscessus TaxID=36809 RepID=UPI0009A768BB|nr:hypothetical protein [Mycobacteroides abscessus]SKR94493.1 Uncharacterised protein [Mycobacteroides abscessus subsp. bolletii]SKS03074.1 Uncharacterised protein [Mycobacteroides abscessus subsp. bolletii]DAZ90115.1 TPA_asm: hypothetical protein PROPHIFVLQ01-1_28 [Mycobacterium phage prophiFVLQ01-1]